MSLNDFLQRAADLSAGMTSSHITAIKNLLNPSKKDAALDVICPAPAATKKPGEVKIPVKDLKKPPFTAKK